MFFYTFFAFACSFIYSLSAILCKYGLQYNIDVRNLSVGELIRFLSTNGWWITGVLLSGIANVAMIEIQAHLDVSIVFSFLNFSYILILVLGHYFLREHLNKEQWLGVSAVTIGTLMLLAVRNPVTGSGTDIETLLYFTACAVSVVLILIYTLYKIPNVSYEIFAAMCAGICFGCVEMYLKSSTNLVASENGQFSIFNSVSIKYFLTAWPFFVMFVFGAIGWLFLQVTYTHGSVSVTIPIIAVSQRITSLASGYFVFGEVFSLLRAMGVLAILSGVAILILATLNFDEPQTA